MEWPERPIRFTQVTPTGSIAGVSEPIPPVEDYPTNLLEFESRFDTEASCREYLEKLRWPNGFRCPQCEAKRAWPTGRSGLWECGVCHRQVSATAGTLFEGTKRPLRVWFRVMWFITSEKIGISALGLKRQLGFKRYETVWTWLHKLRRAMVRPGRDQLCGRVEVDETYVGGTEEGVHGRETRDKSIVAIAAQEDGDGIGRIRLKRIPDVSGQTLLRFLKETVAPGSTVHTDGWEGYGKVGLAGYKHEASNIARTERMAHELLPRVHRVAALLKRWWLGTHQGAIRPKYLDYYLDEFTFRFNRRSSRHRGKLFYRLVQQAAQVAPLSWTDVTTTQKGSYNG